MRHCVEQMSPQSHQRILDDMRELGRAGGSRVPDSALFPAANDPTQDLSDTGIHKLVDALNEGRTQRAKAGK